MELRPPPTYVKTKTHSGQGEDSLLERLEQITGLSSGSWLRDEREEITSQALDDRGATTDQSQ